MSGLKSGPVARFLLFERDYPDVKILDGIFTRLRPEPVEKSALEKMLRIEGDIFEADPQLCVWVGGPKVAHHRIQRIQG